jgi:hypothetical protein
MGSDKRTQMRKALIVNQARSLERSPDSDPPAPWCLTRPLHTACLHYRSRDYRKTGNVSSTLFFRTVVLSATCSDARF